MKPPRLRAVLGLAAGAVVVAGLAHAGLVRSGARCPVVSHASPAEIDAFRAVALAPLRGPTDAPRRRALGLTLEQSTRAEVSAWAAGRGGFCAPEAGVSALRCEHVAVEDGPLVDDLYAGFDADDRLMALDLHRKAGAGGDAARRFEEASERLVHDLGPPARRLGEPSAAYLDAAPLRHVADQFRFADFAADVSATNLGNEGVVLREQYRAIPRTPRRGP